MSRKAKRDVDKSPAKIGASDKKVAEAVKLGRRIITMIEEEVPSYARNKAESFFDSVHDGVLEVLATITETERVTPAQLQALENWAEGVGKWVRE